MSVFETRSELILSILSLALLSLVVTLATNPVEKIVEVEKIVIKEVPVKEIVNVPIPCPPCTTTIKEIIKEPCPEKKCSCVAMGSWAK